MTDCIMFPAMDRVSRKIRGLDFHKYPRSRIRFYENHVCGASNDEFIEWFPEFTKEQESYGCGTRSTFLSLLVGDMNILLGQGTPVPPRFYSREREIDPLGKRGWSQKGNEEKLDLAVLNGYEILVTTVKDLRHQQNIFKRKLVVEVLLNTR